MEDGAAVAAVAALAPVAQVAFETEWGGRHGGHPCGRWGRSAAAGTRNAGSWCGICGCMAGV